MEHGACNKLKEDTHLFKGNVEHIQYTIQKGEGENTILNLAAIFTSLRKLNKLKVLVNMQFQRTELNLFVLVVTRSPQ